MAAIAVMLLILIFAMIFKRVKRLQDNIDFKKGQNIIFQEQIDHINIEELEAFEARYKKYQEKERKKKELAE